MDEELEKAIDEVGRDRVFDRAAAYGWPRGSGAPKWVWLGIVAELKMDIPPPVLASSPGVFDFLWRSPVT